MEVMDRFVAEYPYSDYLDEVYFRRGEYWFVRKRYLRRRGILRRNHSHGRVIETTTSWRSTNRAGRSTSRRCTKSRCTSTWRCSITASRLVTTSTRSTTKNDEHRLADTFRVISLSFSNLGGPEVVDEYFARNGHRIYADKIYGNLAEFYFEKLRYEDAASVYKSFVDLNPYHKVSPHFSMRVVDIYGEAGFPRLVVEVKERVRLALRA